MKQPPNTIAPDSGAALWLEFPPHSKKRPERLLVFLHGAGSSPEMFAPVALAWQFNFPGARAILLGGLQQGFTGSGRDWFDPRLKGAEAALEAGTAAREVARRISSAQQSLGVSPEKTMLIGFSQGASMALEVSRLGTAPASITVSYAGRLLRPLSPGDAIRSTVHLVHGEFDTQVYAQNSQRAFRSLRDAGSTVSLDIVADGIHSIGQDMINIGTTRAMQTVFKQRKSISVGQYHAALTLSLDSNQFADHEQTNRRSH